MSSALNELNAGLTKSFSGGARHPETWSDATRMEKARIQVEREFGGAAIQADPRSIMASVAKFRKTRSVTNFRELKYICLGAGAVDARGWCVLADEELRDQIVRIISDEKQSSRSLRCYQALLATYFSFPLNAIQPEAKAAKGWESLRTWLRTQRGRIAAAKGNSLPWVKALKAHAQLLTDKPCDGFGAEMLKGNSKALNDALDELSIPRDSWVVEEAVFAQIKAADRLIDSSFSAMLPDMIAIVNGKSGFALVDSLKIRCVAALVSRYARSSNRPEISALRDLATNVIGNPWLRRTNWDAWVRVDERPDGDAREMIFSWLKGRLVADFFELLSADGVNDSRRLAYWLRLVPFIEDMWFALGTSALSRRDSNFNEFRNRARGRLLELEGTTADNNAFAMRIGEYLAVEFGAHGNAFYLLRWDSLPPAVKRALTSGKLSEAIAISQLRPSNNEMRLIHRDSQVAVKSWEQKFEDALLPALGIKPDTQPACIPEIEGLLQELSVEVFDGRRFGGAIWIRHHERNTHLARKLSSMGFVFRSGGGWGKD